MRQTVAVRPGLAIAAGRSTMIGALLPEAASAEAFGDVPESAMYPAEAVLVARAGARRRREFGTVRHCARNALRSLGAPDVALLPDADGVPVWPDGVIGSLTHCDGYRGAAVARTEQIRGLGIDAEPHDALPDRVRELVLRDEEQARSRTLTAVWPDVHWDRVVFCAKEAVYKAWFPPTRQWLGFSDVSISLGVDGGLQADLRPGRIAAGRRMPERLAGRWLVGRGLVVVAAWIAAPGSGLPSDIGPQAAVR
jgi:4'-phosphopantetheinyl transferase EntD